MSTKVLVIIATTRPGRLGSAVAAWFTDTVADMSGPSGVGIEVVDLAEVDLPFLDEPEHPSQGAYVHEHTRAWSRRIAAADAFVIVTPEYNYGMPAVLKNALDYLAAEWAWKPVAFISYGNTSAGTRSVQMTKQVVTTLRMVPIGATVALRIADAVEDGRVSVSETTEAAARNVLTELVRVDHALRSLRGRGAEPELGAPVDGLELAPIHDGDLAELLVLQRCSWVAEVLDNETLELPQLRESLADLRSMNATWRGWCVRRNGRLIAAVRARREGADWHIGRLMVAPDHAGLGIGSWLLEYAERQAEPDVARVVLFTGRRSQRNIALYRRAGYAPTVVPTGGSEVETVRLTKELLATA